MGNLLGSPVTTKETHRGSTSDGQPFAVSSMQGWRVHMEDAHIAEPALYAVDHQTNEDNGTTTEVRIDLAGHALFAVFDGHGGTFAATYAGRNLCRVLSRQRKFVEYAQFEQERPQKEKSFTKSEERSHYIQSGLNLLQQALRDAFIEIDYEIATALKGSQVPEADQPYHPETEQQHQQTNDADMNHSNPDDAANPNSIDNPGPAADVVDANMSPADAALRLLQEEGDSGTTACVVVVTPEWVVCANAGDSRAVMSKLGNRVVPLSYDHKPDDETEEQRIRAAGGYVAGGRVEGDLAVSRGLGDYRFKHMDTVMSAMTSVKQEEAENEAAAAEAEASGGDELMTTPPRHERHEPGDQKVSPIPDMVVQNRNASQDEFIIIACDGIWDVQTNYEGVKTVADLFEEGESDVGLVCEEILDICLQMGSKDNMTALVIQFDAQKVGDGGGVLARRQQREAEANESSKNEDAS